MSAIFLQNEIVHYEVLGRGRPLVFLHGWIGSWRYWIPSMQVASITFRTYAIDLWGFGDTAKKPENYPLDKQINLLEDFIHEMGFEKVALIGHGLGAIIALNYAIRNNKDVDRLLLVSIPRVNQKSNAQFFSSSPQQLSDWLLSRTLDGTSVRSEAPKADPRALQLSMLDLETIDLNSLISKIYIPCLIVHGRNDPQLENPTSQQFTNFLSYTTHCIVFDDSGHFPMLDEPNKFNRLMVDFLSLNSAVSPAQLQVKEEWKRRVR